VRPPEGKTRLLSLKQDWFLNLDHGLDWFGNMARRGADRA
jgi:hypothetical protein